MSNDKDLIEKVVNEAIQVQEISVDIIRTNRHSTFELSHAKPFVDVVSNMESHPSQSEEAFNLYKKSVITHYHVLSSLTSKLSAKECVFLEYQQTPVVLEILYEIDRDFRHSIEEFVRVIDDSDDILMLEAIRLHCGYYGITSAKDFAAVPGSTFNILVQILERADIDREHKKAILAAKSWGLNTTYVFGDKFTRTLRRTRDINMALKEEREFLKNIWLEPVKTSKKLMAEWVPFEGFGQSGYDRNRYFDGYMNKFKKYVYEAHKSGVHLANIVMLPTHVGDIGHHIGPSYYNLCKDEMCMNILESVTQVMAKTLKNAYHMGEIKGIPDIGSIATGSTAAAMVTILEWEGFTSDMFIELFSRRFENYKLEHPFDRVMVGDLHVNDFLDFISRGEQIIRERPMGYGGYIGKTKVDLSPLLFNTELNNPQWYAFPGCAITTRTTALLRFVDQPCLLAPEPPSIVTLVNLVSMYPEKAIFPAELCKKCASARYLPSKCSYCRSKNLGI